MEGGGGRGGLVLTIWPPVWRCCCCWNMAESSDIPLRAQYLLENIIIAGCILGGCSRPGPGFITWDEAMGNQWVYEYQGSSLPLCCSTQTLGELP